MIRYPNGAPAKTKTQRKKTSKPVKTGNRGMGLESDINDSNLYYLEKNLCLITKRPTPINVVKVDYTRGAIITNAYFEKQSTTDYNGVYKGRYIDFEAKSTHSKTSLPLSNIPPQQVAHLERVLEHGGIAFFIIEFTMLQEVYLIDAKHVIDFINKKERQSLSYDFIKTNGYEIKRGFHPRLDYLPIIEEKYFK
ncbi:MAG: Holliday junction resolvase RecU [Bacilli bacterium]|nr:Holliday junction resolvase RecU [Bacilli bacterium]